MNKKLYLPLAMMMIFSMLLSACAPKVTATSVPTQAPTELSTEVVVATEPPVVETGPDAQTLFTDLVASLPADKGFGSVKSTALSEELVDKSPFLLDVREAAEVEKDGFIEGSIISRCAKFSSTSINCLVSTNPSWLPAPRVIAAAWSWRLCACWATPMSAT